MPATTDDQPETPATTPARKRVLLVTLGGLAVLVFVLDQLSKVWALRALADGERTDILGDLLGFQLVFNEGAALGIAMGQTWLLTIVATVVVVVIVRAARRIGSTAWAVALGLLLGGALGNLADRLLREPGIAQGRVVDFIAYVDFFVGNVADIAIVVAAGLVVLLAAQGIHIDGTRDRSDRQSGDDAAGAGDRSQEQADDAEPAVPPAPADPVTGQAGA